MTSTNCIYDPNIKNTFFDVAKSITRDGNSEFFITPLVIHLQTSRAIDRSGADCGDQQRRYLPLCLSSAPDSFNYTIENNSHLQKNAENQSKIRNFTPKSARFCPKMCAEKVKMLDLEIKKIKNDVEINRSYIQTLRK